MSLDKNLTNRIFRIAVQAESAVIILINQQASAFGTDVSGQFFASPPKKFTGPIEAQLHPHLHDRASRRKTPAAAFQTLLGFGTARRSTMYEQIRGARDLNRNLLGLAEATR